MYKLLKPLERRGTDCSKWDNLEAMFGNPDLHAMWVADMDFKEPECITKALLDHISTTALGYYITPDRYYNAFMGWWKQHHGYEIQKDWICFAPGVVPALHWLVEALTRPGDPIIVLTPVYYPFFGAIQQHGRRLVQCDLNDDNGIFTIDFEKFEKTIVEEGVKAFILCSPHNPVGRAWTCDELRQLTDICKKHGVQVFSDEIHADFVYREEGHHPTAVCAEDGSCIITLASASKTFNLAGMKNAFVVIPDEDTRKKYKDYQGSICEGSGASLGYIAYTAAYEEGYEWLQELKAAIKENEQYAIDAFKAAGLDVVLSPLEGTYLLCIDLKNYIKGDEMKEFLQDRCNLALDYGSWFGGDRFATLCRMNLATSLDNVKIGIDAMVRELKKLA